MKKSTKNGAYTRQKLADEYGITVKTLKAWLEKAGVKIPSGDISPKNKALIREALGNPSMEANVENEVINNP